MPSKTHEAPVEAKDEVLVKRGDQALATNAIPEYLRAQIGNQEGSEDVGRDDVLIPRLCIAQDLTPQRKKHNENYNPDLELGDLFDSVTGEIYAKEGQPVQVVPLFFFKNWIKFIPQSQGGGVAAFYDQNNPPKAADTAWVDGNPPDVTEFKNRMVLLVREGQKPRAMTVSFKSTGLKEAKKWNSLILDTKLPAYACTYALKSKVKIKGEQSWHIMQVEKSGFVPQEFFSQAQEFFNQLKTAGYKVDTTGLDTEAKGANPDADTSF